MSLLREWVQRLHRTFRRARRDEDFYKEFRAHAELAAEAAERGDPNAHVALPQRAQLIPAPEAPSTRRGILWPAALERDFRYALRQMGRHPYATAVSVLTVALGIAATTTLFSLAYGVLYRPLPWPDAERLVRVSETRGGAARVLPIVSNIAYSAWSDQPSTIESLAAYRERTFVIERGDSLEQVQGAVVTPSLFALLGASPRLGRVFTASDEGVLLVSERFARSRFADSAAALGQPLRLSGVAFTVIGVLGPDFGFPNPSVDVWTRFAVPPATQDGTLAIFSVIARLRPGVTVQQAAEEATTRARSAPYPEVAAVGMFGGGGPVEVRVESWLDSLTRQTRSALLLLLAGVVLLLLAAIGTLANLELARATGRRQELAVRAALGAKRFHIARQLLLEPLSVAAVGGIVGLLLTKWGHSVLPLWMAADFPRLDAVAFDLAIVAAGAGLALATGLLVGAVSTWQTGRINLVSALAEDGRAPIGHSWRHLVARARAIIITGQIAISVLLLVGAGLLGRSLLHLTRLDHGYSPNNLLTGRIISAVPATPRNGLPGLGELVRRLSVLPNVSGVALANALPLPSTGESAVGMKLDVDKDHPTPVEIHATQRTVSAGYFDTLGIPVVRGRVFGAAESKGQGPTPLGPNALRGQGPTPVVVNEAFARHYLPAERPIGPLGRRRDGTPFYEVIGVVGNVSLPTGEPPEPQLFVSFGDLDRAFGQPMLFVRTVGDPAPVITTIRRLMREVSPTLGLDGALTMSAKLAETNAKPRLFTVIAMMLAGFSLLIALTGLFGVLAYSVAERRREIGISAALGATRGQIVRGVVTQGLGLAVAGVGLGLAAAVLLARSISSMLYGVRLFDPVTFIAVPLVVLAAAVLACLLPASRAARIDPWQALRQS